MGNRCLTRVQEGSSNRESHPSVRADAERFAIRSLPCCRPPATVGPKDAALEIATKPNIPPDDRLVEAEVRKCHDDCRDLLAQRDVRFGSLADIREPIRDVRFTSKSRTC